MVVGGVWCDVRPTRRSRHTAESLERSGTRARQRPSSGRWCPRRATWRIRGVGRRRLHQARSGTGSRPLPVLAAAAMATVMAAGAFYGWLVCLCWPEHHEPARRLESRPGRAAMAEYGLRLGLAGALCTGTGFALDLEHKGWATAACLLVMRPTPEMTRLRGAGRAVSVTAGARWSRASSLSATSSRSLWWPPFRALPLPAAVVGASPAASPRLSRSSC